MTPGCTVLDIGTGSGLLSMLAARAGAGRVYTCEMIDSLAQTAREIIDDNGLADRIQVFNKRSTDLRIGEDIAEPVDVLVTETVGVGLLGERTLETISHARANLVRPNAKVIPRGATVHGMLVESEALVSMDRVDDICGFDLGRFNRFAASPQFWKAKLGDIAHRGLCQPFEVFSFCFDRDALPAKKRDLQVSIDASGEAHALVFWFDLHLHPQVTIATGPHDAATHWEQAVQLLAPSKHLTAGATAHIRAHQDGVRIWFELR